jgi:DnaJ-class molecular chaperone
MNDIVYIDCPRCEGEGKQIEAHLYPTGHTEVWVNCPYCDGEGQFDEADYLMMKLEGIV